MEFPAIDTLVPHDGAMVLLGRVLAVDADSLSAEVTISPASLFFEQGGVGAWIGIEYMAQAISAHAGYHAMIKGEPVKIGFLLGTRRYHCSAAQFADGSVLQVQVQRVVQGDNGLGAFDSRITDTASGAVLASGTITVFQPDSVARSAT